MNSILISGFILIGLLLPLFVIIFSLKTREVKTVKHRKHIKKIYILISSFLSITGFILLFLRPPLASMIPGLVVLGFNYILIIWIFFSYRINISK